MDLERHRGRGTRAGPRHLPGGWVPAPQTGFIPRWEPWAGQPPQLWSPFEGHALTLGFTPFGTGSLGACLVTTIQTYQPIISTRVQVTFWVWAVACRSSRRCVGEQVQLGFQSHFVYKTGGHASGHGLLAAGLDQQTAEGMAGSQGLFLVSPTFPTQTSHPCTDTGQKRGEAVRARQPLQRSWRQ